MAVATIGAFAIGDYPEAVAVMLFSRIGEAMEERAVNRSRKQVAAAIDMRPDVIHRLMEDGSTVEVPARDAAVGDIAVVRVGDRIPLDGVVVSGDSLLDTSALTGEPVPISCMKGLKSCRAASIRRASSTSRLRNLWPNRWSPKFWNPSKKRRPENRRSIALSLAFPAFIRRPSSPSPRLRLSSRP